MSRRKKLTGRRRKNSQRLRRRKKSAAGRALTRRQFLALGAGGVVGAGLGACSQSSGAGQPDAAPQPDAAAQPDAAPRPDVAVPDAAPDTGTADAQATGFDPDAVPQDDSLFSLGVQAGAMHKDNVLLWSHSEDGQSKILRVWQDTGTPGQVLIAHAGQVLAVDGYMKETVTNLQPGTWYRYAFFDGTSEPFQGRSEIGNFRTALDDGVLEPITIGATACTNASNMPYQSLQVMANYPMDAFLQLGDMSYNDGSSTQAEFRQLWRDTLMDPGYRAILPATGMYNTWDDHEITDNSQLYNLDPVIWQIGKDAWFETLAVPRFPNDRIWDSYRWGATVEFFVLDSRSERDPNNDIYLSQVQMDWLKQGLLDSPCHFKVLLNSVPVIGFPIPPWFLEGDRWQGYQAQRDELLDHIVNNQISNCWFLSGDFHVGVVARLEDPAGGDPRSEMWEILVGPGANGPNPLEFCGPFCDFPYPPSQFDYHSGEFAATLVTFDPAANNVRVQFIDTNDQPLYDNVLTNNL